MVERVRKDGAAKILGVPARTVQALAARGEIPGTKIGRLWTFDPDRLREWARSKEDAAKCRESPRMMASTREAKRGGSASRLKVKRSDEAYEQAMRALLGGRPNPQ